MTGRLQEKQLDSWFLIFYFLQIHAESPYISHTYTAKYRTRDILRHDNIIKCKSWYELPTALLANSTNPYAQAVARNQTTDMAHFIVKVKMDETVQNQQNSMFGILIIILTIVMLFTFTASFNSTVARLVVKPLEQMMGTLRNSALSMLTMMKANTEDETKNGEDKKKLNGDDNSEEDDEMETAMLEKMVHLLLF
jgi:hypothetical protein